MRPVTNSSIKPPVKAAFKTPRIMIIAGEASGDRHGAKLVEALRETRQGVSLFGIGGGAMQSAGVEILLDAATLSVVGITEVVAKLSAISRGLRTAKHALKNHRPDLLILIDFPDFNLHVAAAAKKLGIPVLYYISPQIWAWRPGRVKTIKRLVDHMAVILPFEADFYDRCGVPVTFVGHPLMDMDESQRTASVSPKRDGRPTVGILPGSRDKEIMRHLPLMLAAARRLTRQVNGIDFIVSAAPTVQMTSLQSLVARFQDHLALTVSTEPVATIFTRCELVIVASGTVTLEAAIWGTPMVIIYKVSPISYWLGRLLVKVSSIGLINLIAGEKIVPELIQQEASVDNITDTARRMLRDAHGLRRTGERLLEACKALGGTGASRRVARIALDMLG